MKTYAAPGHAVLLCPQLLQPDQGGAPAASANVRHRQVDFYWQTGSDHIDAHYSCNEGCHDTLRCECGEQLVYVALDNPNTFATNEAMS